MQFSHIIALIDAHLERLLEARRLLAKPDLPTTRRKVTTSLANRLAESKSAGRDDSRRPIEAITQPKGSPRKISNPATQKVKTEKRSVASAQGNKMPSMAASDSRRVPAKRREPETQIIERGNLSEIMPTARRRMNQPSQRKPLAEKPSVKSGALPLGGKVPTGPVAIPANQIQREQSLRQRELEMKNGDPVQSASDVPLTAELLSQRWMQGLQDPLSRSLKR